MSKRIDPIAYYNNQARSFALQATDKRANRFEYEKNMPSLLELCNPHGGNVLDFGCGAGNFTAMLERKNRIVEGSDTSPKLLEIAKHNYPYIKFVTSNREGEIDTSSIYNLIIAKLVFHYINDLDKVLHNINVKLRIDGRLVFSVPHPDKTQQHFSLLTEEGSYIDEVGNFGLTLPMVHRTLGRFSTLLTNNGFIIEESTTVYDNEKPKRLNILAKKVA